MGYNTKRIRNVG